MGIFDFFRKKDDLVTHSDHMTMEEIQQVQESLAGKMDDKVYNNDFNSGCRLIPKGQFAEAIALFEKAKADAPSDEQRGSCDNQIGVCHFFLGDFEKAIEHYLSCYHSGFDKGMADDNIWEACGELMKKTSDKAKWAKHYLDMLPAGKYSKKANTYL